MRTRPTRMKIAGRWWQFRYGNVPQGRRKDRTLGVCDLATHTIHVADNLSPSNELGVLIHEVLHASLPNVTEKGVQEAEKALMKVLGHRR